MDRDGLDEVASFDGVDDILTFCRFSEDSVLAVEVWRGAMRDEKLRAVRIRSGVCHGEHSGLVVAAVRFALAFELVAGVACSGAKRAAALDHEVRNDAVERKSVVEIP